MGSPTLFGRLVPSLDNFYRRRGEVRCLEDLPYTDQADAKRALDLFLPRGEGPFPLVVFFHGGGWKPQDRKLLRWASGLYGNVGVALACEGLAVAVPSFRQDGTITSSLDDAVAAIGWLRAHAREHGIDAGRLSLAGHSAGGHLALTLAWRESERVGPVRAVASLAACYDLKRLAAAMGGDFAEAVLRYGVDDATMQRQSLEAHLPPGARLFVASCSDEVPALRREHELFVEACRRGGVAPEVADIEGVGHMGLALEVGRARDRLGPALARFLRES